MPDGLDLVDVTSIVERIEFQDSGNRCCCDKRKKRTGLVGGLRRETGPFANYCRIALVHHCGDTMIVKETVRSHKYQDTEGPSGDGKCEILGDEVPKLLKDYGTDADARAILAKYGAPKYYCKPRSPVMLLMNEASIPEASLGESVQFSCPEGQRPVAGQETVECMFDPSPLDVLRHRSVSSCPSPGMRLNFARRTAWLVKATFS